MNFYEKVAVFEAVFEIGKGLTYVLVMAALVKYLWS
jgi:hypothetical protein